MCYIDENRYFNRFQGDEMTLKIDEAFNLLAAITQRAILDATGQNQAHAAEAQSWLDEVCPSWRNHLGKRGRKIKRVR